MPDDLVRDCNEALRHGSDFPTIWQTIIKSHPAVVGIPVQRRDGERAYIEIALLRGDWLVVDLDERKVSLR